MGDDDDVTGEVVGVGDVVGDGVLVLEVAVLVVPGLAAEEVTTGGVMAGGDEGMELPPCAGETDEPAVGDNVADDVPFGVTGLRLQLLTS